MKPDVASSQLKATTAGTGTSGGTTVGGADSTALEGHRTDSSGMAAVDTKPTRFYGSVKLDATRLGRDAGRIAEEVIGHLAGLQGAKANITLDIEVAAPDGVPENVVRTVTENCKTLKFDNQGFEKE